jgi:hypothetical protein
MSQNLSRGSDTLVFEYGTMNHPNFTCHHINQKQLADRWDLSGRTLERWRAIGWVPLFHKKIGGRVVY